VITESQHIITQFIVTFPELIINCRYIIRYCDRYLPTIVNVDVELEVSKDLPTRDSSKVERMIDNIVIPHEEFTGGIVFRYESCIWSDTADWRCQVINTCEKFNNKAAGVG